MFLVSRLFILGIALTSFVASAASDPTSLNKNAESYSCRIRLTQKSSGVYRMQVILTDGQGGRRTMRVGRPIELGTRWQVDNPVSLGGPSLGRVQASMPEHPSESQPGIVSFQSARDPRERLEAEITSRIAPNGVRPISLLKGTIPNFYPKDIENALTDFRDALLKAFGYKSVIIQNHFPVQDESEQIFRERDTPFERPALALAPLRRVELEDYLALARDPEFATQARARLAELEQACRGMIGGNDLKYTQMFFATNYEHLTAYLIIEIHDEEKGRSYRFYFEPHGVLLDEEFRNPRMRRSDPMAVNLRTPGGILAGLETLRDDNDDEAAILRRMDPNHQN